MFPSESCRRAHYAPLYQVVYIPRNDYEIIEGSQYCKVAKRPRGKKEKEEEEEEGKGKEKRSEILEDTRDEKELERRRRRKSRLCLRYFCTECGSRIKNELVENKEEVSAKPGIDGNEDEDGDNDRNKRQQKEENDRNLPEEPLNLYVGFFPSTLDLELQYEPLRPVYFNPSAHFPSEETVLDLDKLLDGIERK